MDFTKWAGIPWTIETHIEGKPDAEGGDTIKFQWDSDNNKFTISDFNCIHGGAHGGFWREAKCLGNENAVSGTMKNGVLFCIVCSDITDTDGRVVTHKLSCAIDSDLTQAFHLPNKLKQGAAASTTCWTANDGGHV